LVNSINSCKTDFIHSKKY